MKKPFLLLLLIPAVAAIAVPARIFLHSTTYVVDVNASHVEWVAEKVTGKHNGTIMLSEGAILNNHGQLDGKIVMDMKTITVTDLPADKKGKLEGHLKSEDFFSVEKFPISTFEITSIAPLTDVKEGGPNFNVTGRMTIKGKTNEISFPAQIKFDGYKMFTKVDLKIDRSKYDIRYGSKTFFPDIGDKAIADEFLLKIDLVAIQK